MRASYGARSAYDARMHEETDDAQVDGDIASVSARVTGTVAKVLVKDNQVVAAGDVLATLETEELRIALDQARAGLGEAEALLRVEDPSVAAAETSTAASVELAKAESAAAAADLSAAAAERQRFAAQLAQAEAAKGLAARELARTKDLVEAGASTRSDLEAKTAAFDAASAAVDATKQALQAASDKIGSSRARGVAAASKQSEATTNAPRLVDAKKAQLDVRKATVAAAKARVERAELDLSHAKIVAPFAGVVGRRSVASGDHVVPGQALFAITRVDDLWVTANFRETQIRAMEPSQRVTVHVDALDRDFTGTVESLAGATGSRFALLPPENASGNYVKVVQRVPVRIHLDDNQPFAERLRPGMSVEPKVRVR
jgi:membrane fusion protein (multidrug efflux system)